MFKVIVAGSRTFENYELLCEKLDYFLQNKNKKEIEIISGTTRGADRLGERYCKSRGLTLTQFPADWNRYGKKAGYLRNEEMAKYADACVCFWNGKSKGTEHMIKLAKNHNLNLKIIKI